MISFLAGVSEGVKSEFRNTEVIIIECHAASLSRQPWSESFPKRQHTATGPISGFLVQVLRGRLEGVPRGRSTRQTCTYYNYFFDRFLRRCSHTNWQSKASGCRS